MRGNHVLKASAHLACGLGVATLGFLSGVPASITLGVAMGANAPDWLELPTHIGDQRLSLIPHRTLTHWLLPWLLLVIYIVQTHLAQDFQAQLLIGFCGGAIVHIVMDATTKMGVPVFVPWKRQGIQPALLVAAIGALVLYGILYFG